MATPSGKTLHRGPAERRVEPGRNRSLRHEIAQGDTRLEQDGTLWLAAVNLILWVGLFLYLMRLDSKIGREEKDR